MRSRFIKYSRIFPGMGRREIGLILFNSLGSPFLGMGTMSATFQPIGKMLDSRHRFSKSVNKSWIANKANFSSLALIPSRQDDLCMSICLTCSKTEFADIGAITGQIMLCGGGSLQTALAGPIYQPDCY